VRVDFEDIWLLKSNFITVDEKKLVSWPGPQTNKVEKSSILLIKAFVVLQGQKEEDEKAAIRIPQFLFI
jgi:hypothetical protein